MLYVCTVCKHPQGCTLTNHSGDKILTIHCTADEKGYIRCCHWLPVPVRVSPKHQSDIYNDPQGEPYTGLTTFIQTPMCDPIRPVMEASAKTAEELRKEKEQKCRKS